MSGLWLEAVKNVLPVLPYYRRTARRRNIYWAAVRRPVRLQIFTLAADAIETAVIEQPLPILILFEP